MSIEITEGEAVSYFLLTECISFVRWQNFVIGRLVIALYDTENIFFIHLRIHVQVCVHVFVKALFFKFGTSRVNYMSVWITTKLQNNNSYNTFYRLIYYPEQSVDDSKVKCDIMQNICQ